MRMRTFARGLSAVLLLISGSGGCGGDTSSTVLAFDSGPFHVVGELRLPEGAGPHPVVVFVHGDGPNNRTSGVTYPPIMERMLRAGYATFAWDKPGTGESTGRIDRRRLGAQRARIVLDAVALLKGRPDIDSDRIGLWGISQAGYVMPRVLVESEDVAFMIAVSCPGCPGVEQGAYLAAAQARCEGASDAEFAQLRQGLARIEYVTTYEQYLREAATLRSIPAVALLERQGISVGGQTEKEWHLPDLQGEYFYDPMAVIARTTIPVLAVFGERDTQIDPIQGAQAWREALERAGNPDFRVELIPGTDHNIILSETGCLEERAKRSRSGWRHYAPGYLDLIEEWLGERHAR
jgi:pimeloyl-ACP methyl ester carboxylesterase